MTALAPETGLSAWRGPDLDWRSEALHTLSNAERQEIAEAVRAVRGRDIPDLTPASFPLPTLGPRLRRLAEDLRVGRGFLLLRGISVDEWEADDLARIYAGLGAHLGRLVPQSWHGELLGHVMDVSDVEAHARGYQAGGSQRFHTDTCDIVSLMCIRAARSGGVSRIASVAALHNRLLEIRPDLLETLYGDYVFRRMELDSQHGSGRLVKTVAIFSRPSGQLSCNVSGSYPNRAVQAGDAVMTARQIEALDELERLAASPEFYLDMTIGEGDIQFLNNRTILHGRTGYEDWPDLARRRHLMRLWLEVPSWPPLPANQGMHGSDDHAGWLRQRTPFMELPSRWMAAMTARKAVLA
ncbi:MAG: TauD/TfdA family dioxygenase [Rhodospirillales bacterium]|nr:TauD/TfdA family dioxygenase [Rhodospirillales bacterium]